VGYQGFPKFVGPWPLITKRNC